MSILLATASDGATRTVVLDGESLTLGRVCDGPLCFPEDPGLSRRHCLFERQGDQWAVSDMGSKNGTHVNGAPLKGMHLLQDGDLIQVAFVAKLAYVGSEATMPLRIDTTPAGDLVSAGRLRLDSASRRVWVSDIEMSPPLSVPQFRFLEQLYRRPGQVCSREEVINVVWPEAQGAGVSEQAIDALVRRLRDRLNEIDPDHQYVATVRGHGFRLDNPPVD